MVHFQVHGGVPGPRGALQLYGHLPLIHQY